MRLRGEESLIYEFNGVRAVMDNDDGENDHTIEVNVSALPVFIEITKP